MVRQVQEIERLDLRLEFCRQKRGVLRADLERDQRVGIVQHGMTDVRDHGLAKFLVRVKRQDVRQETALFRICIPSRSFRYHAQPFYHEVRFCLIRISFYSKTPFEQRAMVSSAFMEPFMARNFRSRKLCAGQKLWATLGIAALAVLALAHSAAAYSTFKTVHAFCVDGYLCRDGSFPRSQVLIDQLGNVYSGPTGGGKFGNGTVVRIAPPLWKWKTLHSFCAPGWNCNAQGEGSSALIIDTSGNLYGLSSSTDPGGDEYGILFELSNSNGKWVFSVKHKFCKKSCPDSGGSYPLNDGLAYAGQATGAPWDGVSPLYGVTEQGGKNDGGVVFQMLPSNAGWKETVIHNFESNVYPNGLIADAAGHLYGSGNLGGKYGFGFLYKLVQNGDGTWTQTVMHNFCKHCGNLPIGRLFLDKSRNLFGTTAAGGSSPYCPNVPCGVVFELTSDGQYKEIYTFCSLPNCADGFSASGLTMDTAGNLLGSAAFGGVTPNCPPQGNSLGCGTVLELTETAGKWSGEPLYTFCSQAECIDGGIPYSPLTLDSAGNIFGTTYGYGPHGVGAIFEIPH